LHPFCLDHTLKDVTYPVEGCVKAKVGKCGVSVRVQG
jgi:hypothetical protein